MGAKQAQAQGQAASDAAELAIAGCRVQRQHCPPERANGTGAGKRQRGSAATQGTRGPGAQRAAIAEAGIGTSGSASDLVRQSAAAARLDALNIRYGAQLQFDGIPEQRGAG